MILIGTIGQLVFKKFLDQESITYDFEFQAGKFDEFDFKVGKDTNSLSLSVLFCGRISVRKLELLEWLNLNKSLSLGLVIF